MLELMGGLCMYVGSQVTVWVVLSMEKIALFLSSPIAKSTILWHVIQGEFYLDYGMHLCSFIQNSGDRIEG